MSRVVSVDPARIALNSMFATRRKLYVNSQFFAETPLLLPSFSSKALGRDFPAVSHIVRFMSAFITTGVLVSAYDIHYKLLSARTLTFPQLIFLDSGGYEARVEHDLSESYGRGYRPKAWSRRKQEAVLAAWPLAAPTVAVTFDSPSSHSKLRQQCERAEQAQARFPRFAWELLLKPEPRGALAPIEKMLQRIEVLRPFSLIGLTEKELGNSVWERMLNIARLRLALNDARIESAIHVFGSLDALSTAYYFIAGAEIFDGLTWLRFGYVDGVSVYSQNYGPLRHEDGIRSKFEDQYYDMWKNNYYYLERLRTQMINFTRSSDFSVFGPNEGRLRDAHRQLEASVSSARPR